MNWKWYLLAYLPFILITAVLAVYFNTYWVIVGGILGFVFGNLLTLWFNFLTELAKKKKSKKESIWGRLVKIDGVLSLLVLYVVGFIVVVEFYSMSNGYFIRPFFSTCCNSMYPTIQDNQVCLAAIEPVSHSEITTLSDGRRTSLNYFPNEMNVGIGDIINYKYYTVDNIIHRVVDYCPEGIIPPIGVKTKGDNINHDDYVCVPFWAINYKMKWLKCL